MADSHSGICDLHKIMANSPTVFVISAQAWLTYTYRADLWSVFTIAT